MEKIMAVCDVDPEYARQFAEAANERGRTPFTVIPFSGVEPLLEYAKKHEIEILLLGASVTEEMAAGIKARSVIRLSEGGAERGQEKSPWVYKYQSVDGVIREVMAAYCREPMEETYVLLGKRAVVLGVYSPLGRCRKTALALTLGQQLAREGKVLFVSFEEFSGFSRLLETGQKQDLSDVLYFFRQGDFHVMRLRSMVYTLRDMDYILPVQYPEDLEQVSGEDAGLLLEKLAGECGYEYVVVDVGHSLRNRIPVLERCDTIWMPILEDGISAARLEEFDDYLRVTGREHLDEKIRRLKLPRPQGPIRREACLDQLLWGELGDYVRQLMKGGIG